MADDSAVTKMFDSMSRDELDQYARNWALRGTDAMSDTELRKQLKDVQGTTGLSKESDAPLVRKGDPGRGPRH